AMIEGAARQGGIDGDNAMMETLIAFKRAGADAILTYFAPRAAEKLARDACAMFELPRAGMSGEAKPDAYEPDKNPEYFEGVLPRRVVAFCVDAVLIIGPIILL